MLDENSIVDACCARLVSKGYDITSCCKTNERGIDIDAIHPETAVRVVVEAKGGTSTRTDSARYGSPFSATQIFDRVAKGVFTCVQLRAKWPDCTKTLVVLALPESPGFRREVATVEATLLQIGVQVWHFGQFDQ